MHNKNTPKIEGFGVLNKEEAKKRRSARLPHMCSFASLGALEVVQGKSLLVDLSNLGLFLFPFFFSWFC